MVIKNRKFLINPVKIQIYQIVQSYLNKNLDIKENMLMKIILKIKIPKINFKKLIFR